MIRQGQREAEITRAVCGQHFWPPNAEVRIELSPSARTAAAACGTTTCRIFVRNNCGRLVTTLGQPAFYGQHSKATRSSLIFIVSCSISLIALASFNAPYAIHFPPPPLDFYATSRASIGDILSAATAFRLFARDITVYFAFEIDGNLKTGQERGIMSRFFLHKFTSSGVKSFRNPVIAGD